MYLGGFLSSLGNHRTPVFQYIPFFSFSRKIRGNICSTTRLIILKINRHLILGFPQQRGIPFFVNLSFSQILCSPFWVLGNGEEGENFYETEALGKTPRTFPPISTFFRGFDIIFPPKRRPKTPFCESDS